MKILIIEDEEAIADNLRESLEQHRFSVDVAYNGQDGYDLIQDYNYQPTTPIKEGVKRFVAWYIDFFDVKI